MSLHTVAYLTPLYFDEESCLGGGERYPVNLGKGVVDASAGRVRVEILSYGRRSLVRELHHGVTLRVMEAANQPLNPLDVTSWELLDALANVDLVHIHMIYTRSNEVACLVAKQMGKPVVMTDHGGKSSSLGQELGILELADRIVAYSDFGASLYATRRPITVIKGGVDGTLFTPAADQPTPVRDRVLFVGRLLPHKGVDRLIAALPESLPLTLCGRPYHPAYFERLRELSRGKQVKFVMDADDAQIRELYRRAWVNVLPSVYRDCYGIVHAAPELMGFTLLEAMACGTPAICSRVAAMPEFIREGETGFVFDTESELTLQLLELAENSALVERMGRAARQAVEREFDLKVAGRALLGVYEEVMNQARGAAA
ncbi:MAG: glycosyltransferase family 4 protein [Isosphaeraceae bacterium]